MEGAIRRTRRDKAGCDCGREYFRKTSSRKQSDDSEFARQRGTGGGWGWGGWGTFEMAHLAALYSTPRLRRHLHILYQMKMDGTDQRY